MNEPVEDLRDQIANLRRDLRRTRNFAIVAPLVLASLLFSGSKSAPAQPGTLEARELLLKDEAGHVWARLGVDHIRTMWQAHGGDEPTIKEGGRPSLTLFDEHSEKRAMLELDVLGVPSFVMGPDVFEHRSLSLVGENNPRIDLFYEGSHRAALWAGASSGGLELRPPGIGEQLHLRAATEEGANVRVLRNNRELARFPAADGSNE